MADEFIQSCNVFKILGVCKIEVLFPGMSEVIVLMISAVYFHVSIP